jgi:endoglucanase
VRFSGRGGRRLVVSAAALVAATVLGTAACSGASAVSTSGHRTTQTTRTNGEATGEVAPPASTSRCATAAGPFHRNGNQILERNGTPYVTYGMTVGGLQSGDFAARLPADLREIDAAAQSWCVNTIRLQLQQRYLFGPTAALFQKDIGIEVHEAEKHGMLVALNDTTEGDPQGQTPFGTEMYANATTVAFWRQLAKTYAGDQHIIFDIYNEPRLVPPGGCDSPLSWSLWRNGGSVTENVGGKPVTHTYVGMNTLVGDLRADMGVRGLIWAEGPCWANTLNLVTKYQISDPLNLTVYDFHHPTGTHVATTWDTDFGDAYAAGLPVLDGEWTMRSSGTSSNCWPDAYTQVPVYLDYLGTHHIGLVGFQLVADVLVRTNQNLTPANATQILRNWACGNQGGDTLHEGGGQVLANWFSLHNTVARHSTPGTP